MTAYAKSDKTQEKLMVLLEIRSYNSRYLDIALRIPHGYLALEEKIKTLIAGKVARGRIEVNLQVRDDSDEAYAFEINTPKARAYYDSLVQLKDKFNINSEISMDLLVSGGAIIKPAEMGLDMEACWPVFEDCINEALDNLIAMRKKEGDFLEADISVRLNGIKERIDQIQKESSDLLSHYQQRLKDRIAALTKGIIEIDPDRIAQEAAFLADRSDISEEIVRVASHIKQFRTIMNSAEPAGRKLNFLMQELNREFNTMGSKTNNSNVSHIIVEVKSDLEKIREQLQNVE
ncbi:MAG: YicC/YloC family endoribonuclease [Thermodesulfobacteriota bacterium]|nr:YicC/YloC family endoribonuclease [Thermodesulfobacteriota bacterium]